MVAKSNHVPKGKCFAFKPGKICILIFVALHKKMVVILMLTEEEVPYMGGNICLVKNNFSE